MNRLPSTGNLSETRRQVPAQPIPLQYGSPHPVSFNLCSVIKRSSDPKCLLTKLLAAIASESWELAQGE